jgi:hypothetical protein
VEFKKDCIGSDEINGWILLVKNVQNFFLPSVPAVRNSNQTSMNSNHSQPNSKKKKTKVKRIHLKLNPNSNTKSINKHATKHSDTSQNIAANTAQLLDENLRHCFRFDHADIAQKYK